jgi:hypothetical protein
LESCERLEHPLNAGGLEAKMRRLAPEAIVLFCGAACAGAAHAAEPVSVPAAPPSLSSASVAALDLRGNDAISDLLTKAEPVTDAAQVNWTSSEVRFTPKSALRIRVGDPLAPTAHGPLQPPGFAGAQAYELSVVQDWPAAVSFNTRRFGVDLTPHAGVGVTSYGGLAEAGATLQFSQRVDDAVKSSLGRLGVRDGERFGDQGRWYLFAAASGRAVGLNMLRSDAGWSRAGWTTDPASTLVGDAQVGVGWRRGAIQTSLGFVHREMKSDHLLWGQDPPSSDSMVAFSFAVRPRR